MTERAQALEAALEKARQGVIGFAAEIQDGRVPVVGAVRNHLVLNLALIAGFLTDALEAVQPPPPVSPAGASEPPSEDEDDDVPLSESQGSVDAWSAPLRKPVVPKILSMDDFYALLRILEVLPADPFLTDLQAKLSDEERHQYGNRASHLSGSEFVREIERVEDLIQSRLQPAPVSPVEPTPEPPQDGGNPK